MGEGMVKYLVGCDIGTSGAKAVLADVEGRIYGSCYVEYPLYSPRAGWFEHDPNDYWEVFKKNIGAVLKQSGVNPKEIAGVSVSACSPCCILVDREGNALKRSPIWMDRRAKEECEFVRSVYDDDRIFQVSANPLDPHSGAIKLLWEKNNNPDLYKKAYKMLNPANFITMKLTGEFVTDYSNASLIGIFFDIVKREWRTDMIERLGMDADKLTRLVPCHEIAGEVTKKAGAECGLAPGTLVMAGTVDCNAAWLGNGSTRPGDASLVMGTAGALGVVHKEPRFTRNLTTIIHTADSQTLYTTLAGTSTCGGLLRYLRDTFTEKESELLKAEGKDIYDAFSEEASTVPAGADGLIVLPYFSGERTPLWNPDARGMVFGLSFSHRRGHWVRAMMEGGIYAIYHCLRIMQENRLPISNPILVSEGGSKSELWRQIASDILNVDLDYMRDAKGAPMGNVINAGVGAGVFGSFDVAKNFIRVDQTHHPDPGLHRVYESYYALYRKLYEDVKNNYEILSRIKNG